MSTNPAFGEVAGPLFKNIWIKDAHGVLIRAREIKDDISPDLALLLLESPLEVSAPTFLQNIVPDTEAQLRASALVAFGYTQDCNQPKLWRYEIARRILLTSYRQSERTMTQMQLSGGLGRGASGGPVLLRQGSNWLYLGTIYLGGERAATSRLLMSDTVIEFLLRHGISEFRRVDASWALERQTKIPSHSDDESVSAKTKQREGTLPTLCEPKETDRCNSRKPTTDKASGNLPSNRQTFVGREKQIEDLELLVAQASMRLLTISGPGGVGKTALALRLADLMMVRGSDEIWFITLAPIEDPALIWTAIAQSINIQEMPGCSLSSAVTTDLADRSAILILDNFEHLLAGVNIVSEILERAPNIKVIATSRQQLGLAGEREYPLTPLSLPTPSIGYPGPDGYANLATAEAIRLFVDRARAALPTFALTSTNAVDIASLCVQLDGLPLAIELAAARTKLLGPAAIARRLADSHDLLRSARRDVDERHRTLEAAISWSFDLLPVAEATALCNVSVFASWFSIQAASAVCAGNEANVDILNVLSSLVDKSLLQNRIQDDGEPAFNMLRTINQFASNKLQNMDDGSLALDRAILYFLERVENSCQNFHENGQEYDPSIIDLDYANILSILRALADRPVDSEYTELRMCGAVWPYWERRGYFEDAYNRLQNALARAAEAPAGTRARALSGAGTMAWHRRSYADAEELHRESLAAFKSINDVSGVAFATNNIGVQALELDDLETAAAFFQEANQLASSIDARWLMSYAANNLGEIKYRQGDLDASLSYYAESLNSAEAIGDDWLVAVQLSDIGEVLADTKHLIDSASYQRRSLKLLADSGDFDRLAGCFERLARLAARQCDFDIMVQWLAASDTIRTGPMRPSRQARYEQLQRIAFSEVDSNKRKEISDKVVGMSVPEMVEAALDNTSLQSNRVQ